jgi:hypothetical protein
MIKIDFTFDSSYGQFADALHLPEDHTLSDAEIEAIKQQRFAAWLNHIENPPQQDEEV